MSNTRTQQQNAVAGTSAQAENPFDGAPSDSAARAAAYGQIARAAREACQQGDAAVTALHERRNRSGQ